MKKLLVIPAVLIFASLTGGIVLAQTDDRQRPGTQEGTSQDREANEGQELIRERDERSTRQSDRQDRLEGLSDERKAKIAERCTTIVSTVNDKLNAASERHAQRIIKLNEVETELLRLQFFISEFATSENAEEIAAFNTLVDEFLPELQALQLLYGDYQAAVSDAIVAIDCDSAESFEAFHLALEDARALRQQLISDAADLAATYKEEIKILARALITAAVENQSTEETES